ncbi:glucuronate isomerase [Alteromonas sp. KUL49]|uniref:glucuronate isomerase n=1 Tax=Alteromonas sp. KUL49 TaxID=2480798 RepID=UPI00102F1E5A|nr:glucuronate isomerase [Alteromonas sp. KUL49]TAP42280.1 glucuronate isomerase [Alteromonas sp. KUL49]GEA09885.1 uronate isomerase [Alteromonas sp. KUL49]
MSHAYLHPDRLFPSETKAREIARTLYGQVKDLPIISPHGHTDPSWFAQNENFSCPSSLLIQPDHYVFRMLYSQGISLESLGIGRKSLTVEQSKQIWSLFAKHYYLFRGTPSKLWLDYVFADVFNISEPLSEQTADHYYNVINSALKSEAFKPRALFDRFNIEVLATTEQPLDTLEHHQTIKQSSWQGKVVTTFRPDNLTNPEHPLFTESVTKLESMTGMDISDFEGFLAAIKLRRAFFKSQGATATDHSHPTAFTADLSDTEKQALYLKVRAGNYTPEEAELFRGQMITEMVAMSLDDGLVIQLHHGCYRNHNDWVFENYGPDKGADLPLACEYIDALKPMLNKYGNNPDITIILFTLDETSYSRELAPLAGHYPALRLGPAWWFHDSPEGMRRFRQQTLETGGFYNTVGFNDDTRAFLSIPARHDLARRMDCSFLAELVADHRLTMSEAEALAYDLSYRLAKEAYKF